LPPARKKYDLFAHRHDRLARLRLASHKVTNRKGTERTGVRAGGRDQIRRTSEDLAGDGGEIGGVRGGDARRATIAVRYDGTGAGTDAPASRCAPVRSTPTASMTVVWPSPQQLPQTALRVDESGEAWRSPDDWCDPDDE